MEQMDNGNMDKVILNNHFVVVFVVVFEIVFVVVFEIVFMVVFDVVFVIDVVIYYKLCLKLDVENYFFEMVLQ
jgi:hypothetical protein